jgi:predicted nucleotidyltransferase
MAVKTKKSSKQILNIKKKILPVLKKYKVTKAGIFGSLARGENKKRSDVDILAEIDKKYSLLDVIGIKLELEKVIKKKVDLVEYGLIRSEIKENILNDEIRII